MTAIELSETLRKWLPRDNRVVVYIHGEPYEITGVFGHHKEPYAVLTGEAINGFKWEKTIADFPIVEVVECEKYEGE